MSKIKHCLILQKYFLEIFVLAFSLSFAGGSFAAASCSIQFSSMSVDIPSGTMVDAWNLLKKTYFPDLPMSQPHCKTGDRPAGSTTYADITIDKLISEEKLTNGGIGRTYALWKEVHTAICFDDGFVKNSDYSGYFGNDIGYFGPYGATLSCGESQPEKLTLQLTGLAETRPAGTGGTSTIALLAKVMNGTQPKSGVAVSFTVDVTPNSGGHEHHDASRPKGSISKTQGTTDANGEVSLVFAASEIAGIHTVKASCDGCTNNPAVKELQVKVPDLLPISPNPPQNLDGTYVYALTSADNIHAGNGRYHHNQYYLTELSRQNLRALTESFSAEGWGIVALNDASLFWGGLYDIAGNWSPSHVGHRIGKEIDISFVRMNNIISGNKQQQFYKKFCEDKTVEVPFSILHHYVNFPHFHVYLEKQKACAKTEK